MLNACFFFFHDSPQSVSYVAMNVVVVVPSGRSIHGTSVPNLLGSVWGDVKLPVISWKTLKLVCKISTSMGRIQYEIQTLVPGRTLMTS